MSTRLYLALCRLGDRVILPYLPQRLKPAWDHAAGPKTVFFWSPTIKWCLVGAGLADLTRPAEKLSLFQSSALAATGAVWARYCLVIIPKNYYLCSVNVFVFSTGFTQLCRIFNHRRQNPDWEEKAQKAEAGKE